MKTHSAWAQVRHRIDRVYVDLDERALDNLATRILQAVDMVGDGQTAQPHRLPGSDEVVLITYGDTFTDESQPHLQSLRAVWDDHFAQVFSTVHVLPFFPSSSDGGFAIVDYRSIADELGEWSDLADVVGDGGLMVDLVCNHGSAQSEWFVQFLNDEAPGRHYYMEADPQADLSMVTRPRTHPLLREVETAAGTRHVWATFSHDQIDFDFSNPDVLVEFCSILGFYLSQGATRVRLDAIAYLWKQLGTRCIHLPETHQIVKLMRTLVELRDPTALLITETNVPHGDNTSYFGDGDEAHVVYNFTLAPLIVWSLITGQADTLTSWLGRLDPAPDGCAFLNFIASHDGLGLRPIEDLISAAELQPVIDAATEVGGSFSAYSAPGGPRPYELNVSLADLLAGADGAMAQRFVLAHALMLVVQGIPAFYVHSMLVSPGEIQAAIESGHNRDINRGKVTVEQANERLTAGWRADVFHLVAELIQLRRAQPAFAPDAAQTMHVLDDRVVAIERSAEAQVILGLHNVSEESVMVSVPEAFGVHDLITGESVERQLTLAPWQAAWLTS
ncbi:MAG: sucrose phosphorylase [Acidimicrobiales bacterium]|jgi:sucrose phosphorylase